jgi:hypothetical protein
LRSRLGFGGGSAFNTGIGAANEGKTGRLERMRRV